MVTRPFRSLLSIEVLFSAKHCIWKIADFGLTTEGTSKRARPTEYARGTACYRAPELINENPFFSNKVDIFALGCILFELVTGGRKAFPSDWNLHDYKSRDQLNISFVGIDDSWKLEFEREIYSMLAVDLTDRPPAATLRQKFAQNRAIAVGHECMERKDYQNAITAYNLAIQEGEIGPLVWKLLGDAYNALNCHSESVKAYQSAVDRDLSDSSILVKLGSALHTLGDHGKAVTTYEAAMKKDPANFSLLLQLGDAYLANKQYKQAIKIFQKALKKSGNNAMLLKKLAIAHFENGELDRAFKYDPTLKVESTAPFTDDSLRSPGLNDFTVLYGWSSRPPQGTLKIITSVQPDDVPQLALINANGTKSAVTASSENSSMVTKNQRGRRIKSATFTKPSFGQWVPSSAFLLTPPITNEFNEDSHVSISAKRQEISQTGRVTDVHSDKVIETGGKVAALESYSSKHFDEMSIDYGDLVLVKEIYEDGWALGSKLERKVWEEKKLVITGLQDGMDAKAVADETNPPIERDEISPEANGPAQSYLFELAHFCHSEVWEEVSYPF